MRRTPPRRLGVQRGAGERIRTADRPLTRSSHGRSSPGAHGSESFRTATTKVPEGKTHLGTELAEGSARGASLGSVKWRNQDVSRFERSWGRSLTGSLTIDAMHTQHDTAKVRPEADAKAASDCM